MTAKYDPLMDYYDDDSGGEICDSCGLHVEDRLDVLEAHLRAECARGNGCWMDPAPTACGRPGTHLYEVSAFGIHATGMTVPEAVRAWRTCALAGLAGDSDAAA